MAASLLILMPLSQEASYLCAFNDGRPLAILTVSTLTRMRHLKKSRI